MFIAHCPCKKRAVTPLILKLRATLASMLRSTSLLFIWWGVGWCPCQGREYPELWPLKMQTVADRKFLRSFDEASTPGGVLLQSFFVTLYMRLHWRAQQLASSHSSLSCVHKLPKLGEVMDISHDQWTHFSLLENVNSDFSYQIKRRTLFSFFRGIMSSFWIFDMLVLQYPWQQGALQYDMDFCISAAIMSHPFQCVIGSWDRYSVFWGSFW